MSQMETVTERFHYDETPPSGVDSNTEGDSPRDIWTMLPRDAHFDTFKGAVCLDIWRNVSTKT